MERKVTPNQMCYCFVILAYLIWKIFELRQKVVLFVLDSFIYIYIYLVKGKYTKQTNSQQS